MTTIKFTGTFDRYTPLDGDPHYVFTTDDNKYLVRCLSYPDLISKLFPGDTIDIEAEVLDEDEGLSEGIQLVNVKFGGEV